MGNKQLYEKYPYHTLLCYISFHYYYCPRQCHVPEKFSTQYRKNYYKICHIIFFIQSLISLPHTCFKRLISSSSLCLRANFSSRSLASTGSSRRREDGWRFLSSSRVLACILERSLSLFLSCPKFEIFLNKGKIFVYFTVIKQLNKTLLTYIFNLSW